MGNDLDLIYLVLEIAILVFLIVVTILMAIIIMLFIKQRSSSEAKGNPTKRLPSVLKSPSNTPKQSKTKENATPIKARSKTRNKKEKTNHTIGELSARLVDSLVSNGPQKAQPVDSFDSKNFKFTEESERAYKLMQAPTNNCVFITGKAGTGKSYLLKYFRELTSKQVVYLAPTGVAALNVNGQTIHSFFKFPPRILNPDEIERVRDRKLYQALDTIVIDEISMVRADMMDNIDKFLRLNGKDKNKPFGGVQMIFFGDLYQLPPVTGSDEDESKFLSTYYRSPYFFDAKVFDEITAEMVELNKVYRQKDEQFVELLNAVRVGKVTDTHIDLINQRYSPGYMSPVSERYLTLTPRNKLAADINERELERLPYPPHKYVGTTTGDFKKLMKNLPTDIELVLKKEAQVMLLKNDGNGRWVNGTIGVIQDLNENEIRVEVVSPSDGKKYVYPVEREIWELLKYTFDKETGRIKSESVASISQYPLRLAWAVTIHKSQGMTLDNVIIDIGNGAFAHGQTYVALSRCRTFEGIRLKEELLKTDIKVDPAVHRVRKRFKCDWQEDHVTRSTTVSGKNEPLFVANTDQPYSRPASQPSGPQQKQIYGTVAPNGEVTGKYKNDTKAKLAQIARTFDSGKHDAAREEMQKFFPEGWCSHPEYVRLKRCLYSDRNKGSSNG